MHVHGVPKIHRRVLWKTVLFSCDQEIPRKIFLHHSAINVCLENTSSGTQGRIWLCCFVPLRFQYPGKALLHGAIVEHWLTHVGFVL